MTNDDKTRTRHLDRINALAFQVAGIELGAARRLDDQLERAAATLEAVAADLRAQRAE